MAETPENPTGAVVDQIYFNCPTCAKSLSIDAAGEGYVVSCPTCKTEVQVPPAQVAAEVTSRKLGELRERLEAASHARKLERQRYEKLSEEMAIIQGALDRIIGHIEDGLLQEQELTQAEAPPADE